MTAKVETARAVVRSYETAAISSEVNAVIIYLPTREGDEFRKGDLLVEFDCRRSSAERDAAVAAVKNYQAAYDSQMKLFEYKSAGTAAVDQARFQLEKADAELRLSTVKIESCRILAPFDGRIAEKMAQIHEVAQPNQPLIKIINENKIELVMMVPSSWLPEIKGSRFPVTIDETGDVIEAHILQKTGLIDPISQSSRVIAEIMGPTERIRAGMSGTATLVREEVPQ